MLVSWMLIVGVMLAGIVGVMITYQAPPAGKYERPVFTGIIFTVVVAHTVYQLSL